MLWGSFLAAWLGGARLYRRPAPLFLGIAFGHFFTAGVLWGACSLFLPQQHRRSLHLDTGRVTSHR